LDRRTELLDGIIIDMELSAPGMPISAIFFPAFSMKVPAANSARPRGNKNHRSASGFQTGDFTGFSEAMPRIIAGHSRQLKLLWEYSDRSR
jgi:hypothetical protein